MGVAFDNERYLAEQTEAILERMGRFENKLYLEFGGKLVFDYHASRVLPGFDPNVKIRLLQRLKEHAEIVMCIYAGDIERRKMRADFGISYDADAFKLIDDLRRWGLETRAVVITRFTGQPAAELFRSKLERRGVKTYVHGPINNYPVDVERVVSEEGYGRNDYVETSSPLVIVTAPGPNSGKLGTCLSQVYHEHQRGVRAGFAKFETFPIWNLPLRHPVNAAYESATADLGDVNMIDPHHLEAYGERAVNYNRDVEAFVLLRRILERIGGAETFYASPTDMGVNRAGFAIVDDEAAAEAGRQEILRRYFRCACEALTGTGDDAAVRRIEVLMEEFELRKSHRLVVPAAEEAESRAETKAEKGRHGVYVGAALELPDGTIVTGRNSPLMHAAACLVLNAAKHLAGIPQHLDIISANVIEAIGELRKDILRHDSISLNVAEAMIALSISSTSNPTARLAMDQLEHLRGCEVHMTRLPTPGDEKGLRRLGVNLTCSPRFATDKLFVS